MEKTQKNRFQSARLNALCANDATLPVKSDKYEML